MLFGGDGFAGDQRLIHAGVTLDQGAIYRHLFAWLHAQVIALGDPIKRYLLVATMRVDAMRGKVAVLVPLMPQIVAAYQEKLSLKLREVLATGDEERIRQEVALYGVKIDIAEELSRLSTHLDEVQRVIAKGGAAGKRLDFLMQELNREANTLGSKSVAKELSETAIELKLLIEQMREQIQNIE